MEMITNLVAAAPMNGKVMIGVGTVIHHGNDELIAFPIVVHSPKILRHHDGGGG